MAIDPQGNEVTAKRIGDAIRVKNQESKTSANEDYLYTRIQLEDGQELELLLTDEQVTTAIERAKKNVEDLPGLNWLRDLLD